MVAEMVVFLSSGLSIAVEGGRVEGYGIVWERRERWERRRREM